MTKLLMAFYFDLIKSSRALAYAILVVEIYLLYDILSHSVMVDLAVYRRSSLLGS